MRLKNCIQTILELEPQMHTHGLEPYFAKEFSALRVFLDQIDRMNLLESDVERLESATATFLSELRPSGRIASPRVLQ